MPTKHPPKTDHDPPKGKKAGTAGKETGKHGGCGTGAGGFKAGNTCGGSSDKSAADTQAHPAVQLAHRRIGRSMRRAEDSHTFHVGYILAGKDKDGKVAKFHPKAKEDADALASYKPAMGTVAIGYKPGRPDEKQARKISSLRRDQTKGKDLNQKELDSLTDRDVSHIGVRNGWDDSDKQGHRFLVHNRLTGQNEIYSQAELRSAPTHLREALHGKESLSFKDHDKHYGKYAPIRQFDSQGVEVPVSHSLFRASTHRATRIKRADYKQDEAYHAVERADYKYATRAKFGTSDTKHS